MSLETITSPIIQGGVHICLRFEGLCYVKRSSFDAELACWGSPNFTLAPSKVAWVPNNPDCFSLPSRVYMHMGGGLVLNQG